MKSKYQMLFTSMDNGGQVYTGEKFVTYTVPYKGAKWGKIGDDFFYLVEYLIGDYYAFIEMKPHLKHDGIKHLSNGATGAEYMFSREGRDNLRRRLNAS